MSITDSNGVVKRVVVLPDTHIFSNRGKMDGLDEKTWSSVAQYIDDNKWDEVVHLGDILDFGCISTHNTNNLRVIEGARVAKDYTMGNKFLDELETAVHNYNRECKITVLRGNHDAWIEKYINANPALAGILEMETGLHFAARNINFVDYWIKGDVYKIGKATFIHGQYTNDHHAKKHADAFGCNVFYGHLHDVQGYSKVNRGDNHTLVGQSMGCLNKYDMPYMQGRPSRWQQAFGVFYFLPNGLFNYQVIRIFNHQFISPEGKLYKPE